MVLLLELELFKGNLGNFGLFGYENYNVRYANPAPRDSCQLAVGLVFLVSSNVQ